MEAETLNNAAVRKNWVTHPTKTALALITLMWLVGNGLLVFAVTDFFAAGFLSKKYLMIYMMMVASTWTTVRVFLNYFRQSKA